MIKQSLHEMPMDICMLQHDNKHWALSSQHFCKKTTFVLSKGRWHQNLQTAVKIIQLRMMFSMHMLIEVIVAVLDNQTQLWIKYNFPFTRLVTIRSTCMYGNCKDSPEDGKDNAFKIWCTCVYDWEFIEIHLKMARTMLNLMHMCLRHICLLRKCLFAKIQVRKRAASTMNHDSTGRKFNQFG